MNDVNSIKIGQIYCSIEHNTIITILNIHRDINNNILDIYYYHHGIGTVEKINVTSPGGSKFIGELVFVIDDNYEDFGRKFSEYIEEYEKNE